jgi:hypothetical protein
MLNCYGRTSLAFAAILLGACSNSSGPHAESPAQLARYIDSLRLSAPTSARASYLGAVELGPALGAAPVNVTVQTATGSQVWRGFVWKCTNPAACFQYDSGYTLVAYSDDSLSNILIASEFYLSDPYNPTQLQLSLSVLPANDSIISGGSGNPANTVSISMTSTGSQCVAASIFQNPDQQWASNCNLGTFEGRVSWTIPGAQRPSFASIQIAQQAFNGVDVK